MPSHSPLRLFKHSSRALLVSAALLLLSTAASRADFTIVSPSDSDPHATNLHLSYRAERLVPRDLAHIELRFEVTGTDPTAITAELNRRVTAAAQHASKLQGATVTVGAFAVVRQTPASFPGAVPGIALQPGAYGTASVLVATGEWKAAQLLTLSGSDMRGLVSLVTQLQQDGAVISDMRFDLAPETLATVRKELTSEGLAKLRAEAQQVAGTMGMQIERYRNLDVMPTEAMQTRFVPYQPAIATAGFNVLQAGELNVSVIVNANVSLTPKVSP